MEQWPPTWFKRIEDIFIHTLKVSWGTRKYWNSSPFWLLISTTRFWISTTFPSFLWLGINLGPLIATPVLAISWTIQLPNLNDRTSTVISYPLLSTSTKFKVVSVWLTFRERWYWLSSCRIFVLRESHSTWWIRKVSTTHRKKTIKLCYDNFAHVRDLHYIHYSSKTGT